jgi:heme-degrading monooxygenase HmoA
MSVHVMSIRKFQIDETEKLNSFLAELSSRSKEQPGHISRETLRSLDSPGEYLVRCEWETVEYWDEWLRSKERRDDLFRVRAFGFSLNWGDIFNNLFFIVHHFYKFGLFCPELPQKTLHHSQA